MSDKKKKKIQKFARSHSLVKCVDLHFLSNLMYYIQKTSEQGLEFTVDLWNSNVFNIIWAIFPQFNFSKCKKENFAFFISHNKLDF